MESRGFFSFRFLFLFVFLSRINIAVNRWRHLASSSLSFVTLFLLSFGYGFLEFRTSFFYLCFLYPSFNSSLSSRINFVCPFVNAPSSSSMPSFQRRTSNISRTGYLMLFLPPTSYFSHIRPSSIVVNSNALRSFTFCGSTERRQFPTYVSPLSSNLSPSPNLRHHY